MTLEHKIEDDVCNYAKEQGVYNVKFKDSSRANAPDRQFFYEGQVLFIEFKKPGEKPRKGQLKYHEFLKSLGFKVAVVDNFDDGVDWINWFKHNISWKGQG
jgi:hypothetical protein